VPTPTIFPIALPNAGIDISKPEQFLDQSFSPYSRNMEFYNEALRGRTGLTKFSETALSGPCLLADQYWKFTGSADQLFCSTKDVYKYDFANSRFDILTPIYSTGTIEVQVGTPTIVRGTGTSWSGSNVKAGDFIRLSSGATYTTAQTWYEVLSVNVGLQQITLTAAAPTTAAGTSYALRQTFTGTTYDVWHSKQFLDDAEGEVWLATNGVDTPIWYNGTGQVQFITGLPTGFTTAKYINVFFNRVIWAWTREGGQNQPIRLRWSDVANFQSYQDDELFDLDAPTAAYWIKGTYVKGDYLIVPKEAGAYVISHIGGDDIFNPVFYSTFNGNFAADSIVEMDRGAYYFGTDNRFRNWDGLADSTPFDDIFEYLNALDPTLSEFIYGHQVKQRKQVRWALPYDSLNDISPVLVYDYGRSIIELWDYMHGSPIRCIGEYREVNDLYVDDPDWADLYVDEVEGFWDDRRFLANAPVVIYGCEDGYIRKADIGNTDDGVAYTRTFDTKRLDFTAPHRRKRLDKQQWWFDSQTSGEVTLKILRDDKTGYEAASKTLSLINPGYDKAKVFVTWGKSFENAKFRISSTSPFTLYGFINWLYPKGKTGNKAL